MIFKPDWIIHNSGNNSELTDCDICCKVYQCVVMSIKRIFGHVTALPGPMNSWKHSCRDSQLKGRGFSCE